MKKQLYIILLLIFSLFLVSCSNKSIDTNEEAVITSGSVLDFDVDKDGVVGGSGSLSEFNGNF